LIKGKAISPYWFIAALGTILFLPLLGSVHLFDWDEINFAESAREMLITGDYGRVTINFQPFWEKPPLFIWLQAISMSIFGVNEFAARLPNALCGIATLMVLFHYGRMYRNAAFGWFWVLVYVGTWLPHAYFKSGIIDPVFNLFMLSGMVHLAMWAAAQGNRQYRHAAFAGLFTGLAVLTKGPVGLLLPGLTAIAFMIIKRKWFLRPLPMLLAAVLFLVTTFAWYGVETMRNGWWFLGEFITYNLRLAQTEDAGHGGFLFYHFVVLLIGCFPASLLIFYKPKQLPESTDTKTPNMQHLHVWMWLALAIVLVVFTIVQTKIIHYSSFAYFPISFLAASVLYRWQEVEVKVPKGLVITIGFGVVLIGSALMFGAFALSTATGMAGVLHSITLTNDVPDTQTWPSYLAIIGLLYLVVAFSGVVIAWKNQLMVGVARIFIATAVTVQLIFILMLPYVEPLSQGAMVSFLKEQAKENVYINVIGFKSYAHYFYGAKQPQDLASPELLKVIAAYKDEFKTDYISPKQFNESEMFWHLYGQIDKPVVFVAKRYKSDKIVREYLHLKQIGTAGGYVFFRRQPF
jgi:4-amino-4-deoxy-L-arabinose transferase-like glycosyltransferase